MYVYVPLARQSAECERNILLDCDTFNIGIIYYSYNSDEDITTNYHLEPE